ncbi:hypothetical protein ACI782_24280 [Geodermatophilus sp. SYSU D00703]
MLRALVSEGCHEELHRDGPPRARGPVVDGRPHGYWAWSRLDGTRLHSGHLDDGREVGGWTTPVESGGPYQVTDRG